LLLLLAAAIGQQQHHNKWQQPHTRAPSRLCPIIVERKSIQDVAMSIYDGRWTNQKRRMYVGHYIFGYDNCRMVYIIEGNENAQTVSGDYVGARWFNVNKERLQEEIANLQSEGFEVLRTPSRENTMFELAR
jgi:ERCC4-type nuclease